MASQSGDVLSGFTFRCSIYPVQSERTCGCSSSLRVPPARPRTSHVASRTWNTCWYPDIALRMVTDHISPLIISTASVMVSCNQLVLTLLPHSVPTESENQTRDNKNLPKDYRYHVLDQKDNRTAEPTSPASVGKRAFPSITCAHVRHASRGWESSESVSRDPPRGDGKARRICQHSHSSARVRATSSHVGAR